LKIEVPVYENIKISC